MEDLGANRGTGQVQVVGQEAVEDLEAIADSHIRRQLSVWGDKEKHIKGRQ